MPPALAPAGLALTLAPGRPTRARDLPARLRLTPRRRTWLLLAGRGFGKTRSV
jgi:phage terminase large subunit-like protein